MKRFYKLVSLYETSGGYGIQLDGKPVKTPAGKIFVCANERLATEAMLEWAAQGDNILPLTMPVNQLLITSLDTLKPRAESEAHILSYADTDLVFYRSDTSPYKERQAEQWGKWTDWFEKKFNVSFLITTDIMPLKQSAEFSKSVSDYIQKLDSLELTIFESLLEDTSSLVLTVAFFENAASVDDLYSAVLIEDMVKAEIYDEEKYGAAPDQEKKRTKMKSGLDAAAKILSVK